MERTYSVKLSKRTAGKKKFSYEYIDAQVAAPYNIKSVIQAVIALGYGPDYGIAEFTPK